MTDRQRQAGATIQLTPEMSLIPETPFLVVLSALARRKYAAKFKSVE